MMNTKNGWKRAFCLLTIGITLGYFLTRLLDKLDCHFISFGHGDNGPKFFQNCCPCADEDTVKTDQDNDETNEAEPYTEPMNETTMHYDEP